jgi:hypothetical protein
MMVKGPVEPERKHLTSAKSGSDWGRQELKAYNIHFSSEDPERFFGQPLHHVTGLEQHYSKYFR